MQGMITLAKLAALKREQEKNASVSKKATSASMSSFGSTRKQADPQTPTQKNVVSGLGGGEIVNKKPMFGKKNNPYKPGTKNWQDFEDRP